MLYADIYLQKIAALGKDKSFEEWEKSLDPKARQERELIEKVQKYNDTFALKELKRAYRGVISQSIQKSGLASVMDYNSAQIHADKAFKELISKNFDLSKQNKPVTYITDVLPKLLNKVRYSFRNTTSRMSEDLSMKSEPLAVADSFLKKELGRKPTTDEAYNFITKELGHKIEKKNIDRIRELSRRELSGNQQIGADTGAEYMTLMDIKNTHDVSSQDIYNKQIKQEQIEQILTTFPKRERTLIRQVLGLGEFKNKKPQNINQAVALNSGMTYYEARKILEKFQQTLRQHGL